MVQKARYTIKYVKVDKLYDIKINEYEDIKIVLKYEELYEHVEFDKLD